MIEVDGDRASNRARQCTRTTVSRYVRTPMSTFAAEEEQTAYTTRLVSAATTRTKQILRATQTTVTPEVTTHFAF